MDRYGGPIPKRKRSFAAVLAYMVKRDGLCEADIPMIARCGGTAIGQLTGEIRPSLAERRNPLAHGDSFKGPATGGLLGLIRDLIDFAYRHYMIEAESFGFASGSNPVLTTLPIMADAQ